MPEMTSLPSSTPALPSGVMNFRDFGGVDTVDGGRVALGRLFRSATLSQMQQPDVDALKALGVQLVCDLRSDNERYHHPTRWLGNDAPETLVMDINTDLRSGRVDLIDTLRSNPTGQGAADMMDQLYREMPRVLLPHLQTLFTRMIEAPQAGILIHCTAGKDRTGVFCALIQSALGVPWDTVMADYLRSHDWCASERFLANIAATLEKSVGQALPDEVVRPIAGVRESYLQATLDAIGRSHGSVEAYLRQATPAPLSLERLRTAVNAR